MYRPLYYSPKIFEGPYYGKQTKWKNAFFASQTEKKAKNGLIST